MDQEWKLDELTYLIGHVDCGGKSLPCRIYIKSSSKLPIKIWVHFNEPATIKYHTIYSEDRKVFISSSYSSSIYNRDSLTFRIQSSEATTIQLRAEFDPPKLSEKAGIGSTLPSVKSINKNSFQEFLDVQIMTSSNTSRLHSSDFEKPKLAVGSVVLQPSRKHPPNNLIHIEALPTFDKATIRRKAILEAMVDHSKRTRALMIRDSLIKDKHKHALDGLDRFLKKRTMLSVAELIDMEKKKELMIQAHWLVAIKFSRIMEDMWKKFEISRLKNQVNNAARATGTSALAMVKIKKKFASAIQKGSSEDPGYAGRASLVALNMFALMLKEKAIRKSKEAVCTLFIANLNAEGLRRPMTLVMLSLENIQRRLRRHMRVKRILHHQFIAKYRERLHKLTSDPSHPDHQVVAQNESLVTGKIEAIFTILYNINLRRHLKDAMNSILGFEHKIASPIMHHDMQREYKLKNKSSRAGSIMLRRSSTIIIPDQLAELRGPDLNNNSVAASIKPSRQNSSRETKPASKGSSPRSTGRLPIDKIPDKYNLLKDFKSAIAIEDVSSTPLQSGEIIARLNVEEPSKVDSIREEEEPEHETVSVVDYTFRAIRHFKGFEKAIHRLDGFSLIKRLITEYVNFSGKSVENREDYAMKKSAKTKLKSLNSLIKKSLKKSEREEEERNLETLKSIRSIAEMAEKMKNAKRLMLYPSNDFMDFLIVRLANYLKDI